MVSLSKIKVSSYVNFLARSQGLRIDDPLVVSEAFLIAYKDDDNEFLSDMFIFSDRGLLLQKENYVNVDGTVCEPYLKVFIKYDRETIIETAKYLWQRKAYRKGYKLLEELSIRGL